jgi:cell division protease FtsH
MVPKPDVKGRQKILEVHTANIPLEDDIDLAVIARGTPGFTGADLANLVNEGALLAARRDREKVSMVELDEAKDKVLMGVERKSMIITEEEKESTAYHEAGHTLVARLIPGSDPIHKVSIIPRGMALGITQQLPIDEKHTYNKEALLSRIAILMGGRVAEEIVLDEVSTGAGNDIERATDMARKMVCEWGMSEKLGPLSFGQKQEQIFLGREFAQHKDYSESTARAIDEEIRRIVTESYDRATRLLKKNLKYLKLLTEELLLKETLDAKEVDEAIKGAKGETPKKKGVPRKKTSASIPAAEPAT